MGSDDEFDQLKFRDGQLVSNDESTPETIDPDPILPNEYSGFLLEIKPGALEVNEPLTEVREEHGELLSFGSRGDAERFADQLSAESGALRLQSAAPNDPSDVHGYLLAEYDRSVREPAETDGKTWTFDVGANLYGSLGEAVVKSGGKPPALEYFVKRDLDGQLDDLEFGLRLNVASGKALPKDVGRLNWHPDCCVIARDGWKDGALERYWCEIKTGNASFERRQVESMRKLAAEERVLKIRVLIDGLPDQYSVRIHEVNAGEE